ncbi:pullulanase-type alpha-1,6-glucosidase [Motilibacter rhizosphaerae]|uniref:Pullulanase-type alpha-1,6-glucosidase n=1 Tax=Motilibacter rhizosphaerae TaxID=598652 RepID=A0A4Q7NU58_9ACTN|nr:pullulanase-type alpha-1,6-glucosidase [Motilibacter rhizosphaerae]RZS90368.1 pullulanase-type alpha-1,6-glucosidase [Motilibacter rhizosphaerae]
MRRRPTRTTSVLLASIIAVPTSVLAATAPGAAAEATTTTSVTLAGSLQSELGCSSDWQPACAATHLTHTGSAVSAPWTGTFTLPAGSYEFKFAIDDSWDENYGAAGAPNGGDIPLVLRSQQQVRISYDPTTHMPSVESTTPVEGQQPNDTSLALDGLRKNLTREQFYFVMADRFANGDTGNDTGGLTGDRSTTGFDPTDKAYYHGGDLKGLTSKLDYIKDLGTTAIWLTPSFKNRAVQGTGTNQSAGYHGYWITDFTQVDPHLGTNADLKGFIAKAHAKGMKVFFDIITNHTADVIQYAEGKNGYVPKADAPYQDASGKVFDDAQYAEKPDFPAMDAKTSFPYTPVVAPADASVKVPSWLNDPTLYHNRGDSTYVGESANYGDFSGLDDLFTENPEVEKGMEDIYTSWVDFGIDGFRIDTMKHVNMEFWQAWSPAILKHAAEVGKPDFFMFGEVYDAKPQVMAPYSKQGKVPATLDFGFQASARDFADGKSTNGLSDFFAQDDYYTDADSNAYDLPTFLGNHDMGRIGYFVKSDNTSDLVQRDELAHDLMFLTRGQPVVYYGDEQGFTGTGGGNDQQARQDMFASKVDYYNGDTLIDGTVAGSKDRYDESSVLYQHIAQLSKLVRQYPALRDGTQIQRYSSSSAGVYAVSRIDPKDKTEYLVAFNNATTTKTASFPTLSRTMPFVSLYPAAKQRLRSDDESRVTMTVPPLSAVVYQARGAADAPAAAPTATFASPVAGSVVGPNAEIRVRIPGSGFAQVTFAYRVLGDQDWTVLGTDDNAPYRVFQDTSALPKGTLLQYRAVVKDLAGHISVATSSGIVGDPAPVASAAGPDTAVVQSSSVTLAGDLDSEMGCTKDWQEDCAAAHLTKRSDDVWSASFDLPAGSFAYKVAIDDSWDENYGAGASKGGGNIPLVVPAGGKRVTFFYDTRTHWVTDDVSSPIVTAAGSFQSELGCTADWSPDCLRSWLQDPDGDGTYTYSTTSIPAGSYETKATVGLGWDEDYGAGGTAGGANIPFTVAADGLRTTFSYDGKSHVLTVTTASAAAKPDLTRQKAYWIDRDTIAWKAGDDPQLSSFRLYTAPDGGLGVDDTDLPGGTSVGLTYDPAGLSAAQKAAFPFLAGYDVLRLPHGWHASDAQAYLTGQLAVARFDDLGHVVDATGLQTSGVIDDVYRSAAGRTLGQTWKGSSGSIALWAPTAKSVELQVFSSATSSAPSTTLALVRDGDGVWTGKVPSAWKGSYYLFDVHVLVPETGKVESNVVTDPYSLGLSKDSTRSLFVDLADASLEPRGWDSLVKPPLLKPEDQSIYELHIRDFSISDPTVPAAHRGTYEAFADTSSAGMEHLRELATSGLTTVHLLPALDFSSVEEDKAQQQQPACDLASYAPDSDQQQACVTAVAGKDGFNWGYDPAHYTTPEGSYATDPDGARRTREFRDMVAALNRVGLRTVMDVVYNHTTDSGQAGTNDLDRIVPGYYHRLDASGAVETSTCCANTATEHLMTGKLLEDSVLTWATAYKVDGFRFDLMGHQPKALMVDLRRKLDALTPAKDGVDGKRVYLYGEGWNFGEVANDARFVQATQANMAGTGIGTFDDRLRDGVRGGGPFDADPRIQGFASGLYTDPNGDAVNGTADQQRAALLHDEDLVKVGLSGSLKDYSFTSSSGKTVTGAQVDYNGSPAGYTSDPQEGVQYVEAHDNETLFDALAYKLPQSTPMAARVRMQTLALATTALSQGVSFWHAGGDTLRSKSFDSNSFDSGDWFDVLDPTYATNGFGRGLPPKASNGAKWSYMQPLLADPALEPTKADILSAKAQAESLLRIRSTSPLLHLGTAALVQQKLSFPATGTPGVIVMRLDDTVGPDVDPALRGMVVVFNATPSATVQTVPGAGAGWSLSPVQAAGSDPVVRAASASGSAFSVPARTVAVFVQR